MSYRHKDEINCSIMYGTWKKLYPTTWIDCSKCFDCACLLCIKSATFASLIFTHSHFSASFRRRIERLLLLPGMGCLERSGWAGWEAGGHSRHSPLGTLEWSQVFKAMGSGSSAEPRWNWSSRVRWLNRWVWNSWSSVTSLGPWLTSWTPA